jgi:hypothetical protein
LKLLDPSFFAAKKAKVAKSVKDDPLSPFYAFFAPKNKIGRGF